MPKSLRRSVAVLLCFLLLSYARPARAESLHAAAVEIIVGIVAVTAAITVAIVLVAKHHPPLKGCATAGPDGLQLTDGSGQTYTLIGDVAALKAGDRVRVSGHKKVNGSSLRFIVEKAKDLGPCPVTQP